MVHAIIDGCEFSTRFLNMQDGVWYRRCIQCQVNKAAKGNFRINHGNIMDRTCVECRELLYDRPDQSKQCIRCTLSKPSTRKFFKTNRGYLTNVCRVCSNSEHKVFGKKYRTRPGSKHWMIHRLSQMRIRAAKDGYVLDEQAVRSLLGSFVEGTPCPCCNRPMDRKNASIDKNIPAKGYIADNIDIICYRCNRIKSDASVVDLENIVNYLKRRMANESED